MTEFREIAYARNQEMPNIVINNDTSIALAIEFFFWRKGFHGWDSVACSILLVDITNYNFDQCIWSFFSE